GIAQHHGNLELPEPVAARRRQFESPSGSIDVVRTGHDREAKLQIIGTPGHRPDYRDVRGSHDAWQGLAAWWADAPRRLVAENTAIMRGIADGGTNIAAGFERGEPRGQRRCRAAGGATRRARKIPGIIGGAVDGVESLPIRKIERHVRFAEKDRASGQE